MERIKEEVGQAVLHVHQLPLLPGGGDPTGDHTYALQLEGTRLLLVMLSLVLYSPGKPAHQFSGWREMMTSQASMLVVPLICGLLLTYMEQTQAPPNMMGEKGASLVLGLASWVWNMLTLGNRNVSSTDPVEGEGDISRHWLDPGLALSQPLHRHSAFTNPYREALFTFSNAPGRVIVLKL